MRRRIPRPPSPISKADIQLGLRLGKVIVQFPDADPQTRKWLEELVEEGKAHVTEWRIHPIERKPYRIFSSRPLADGTTVRLD